MYLPKGAEVRLFEGPACASKVYGAFSADEDELAGDEPRQFADLENAVRCAVMGHGNLDGLSAGGATGILLRLQALYMSPW